MIDPTSGLKKVFYVFLLFLAIMLFGVFNFSGAMFSLIACGVLYAILEFIK